MAFTQAIGTGIEPVGAGERYGQNVVIIGHDLFEDGLKVGRFAQVDNGSLKNMTNGDNQVIAGIVLRDVANPIESGDTLNKPYQSSVSILRAGLGTVEVDADSTQPVFNGIVYAVKSAGEKAGIATADEGSNVITNARFIREIKSGVWLVEVTGQAATSVTASGTWVSPEQYTVATAPDATKTAGKVILVTDGAGGEPVMAYSDGTDWIKLDGTGAVIVGE